MRLQLIIVLVMSLLLVVFTFQNPHPVNMHFVAWGTKQFPLIGIILISVLSGVIVSLLLGIIGSSKTKKKIQELKTELDNTKMPPVVSEDEELFKT